MQRNVKKTSKVVIIIIIVIIYDDDYDHDELICIPGVPKSHSTFVLGIVYNKQTLLVMNTLPSAFTIYPFFFQTHPIRLQ